MKLWLDDERETPDDSWTHTVTAEQCIELISIGKVEEISLDHDLGIGRATGYAVAKYIEEQARLGTLPRIRRISLHTRDAGIGKYKMAVCLRKAKEYWDTHEAFNVERSKRLRRLSRDH